MYSITFPRASDGGYDIMVDGIRVGSIVKGWLRLGGNQWVIVRPNQPQTGRATLAEAKSYISHILKKEIANGYP